MSLRERFESEGEEIGGDAGYGVLAVIRVVGKEVGKEWGRVDKVRV